jgi:hypothetical protein
MLKLMSKIIDLWHDGWCLVPPDEDLSFLRRRHSSIMLNTIKRKEILGSGDENATANHRVAMIRPTFGQTSKRIILE